MEQANRVYIASKVGPDEVLVRELRKELEKRGYEIIYDWTENPIEKPFSQNRELAHQAAERMAKAAMRADIVVVLFAEGGIGFHMETGGALVTSIILAYITGQKKKDIYVVGKGNERSVFYFHDSVTRVPDIATLLEELGEFHPMISQDQLSRVSLAEKTDEDIALLSNWNNEEPTLALLRRLNEAKERFVIRQEFVDASYMRDAERAVQAKLREAKDRRREAYEL